MKPVIVAVNAVKGLPSKVLNWSSAVTVRCALVTVSVAALEVAVAGVHELVNTAWYWLPLMATVGLLMVNVALVASGISLKLTPLFLFNCYGAHRDVPSFPTRRTYLG